METKISQVADSVHGPIQISMFEKCIISTEAFNRMHNIMQNSTAYLTYPSNRTSRFAHSLGVAHLSGKMFFQGIINASSQVRSAFFEKILELIYEQVKDGLVIGNGSLKDEITRIMQKVDDSPLKNIMNKVEYTPADSVEDFLLKLLQNKDFYFHLDEALYIANTPVVVEQQYLAIQAIIFQAIRCAALLHDVGHPPFSHVAEYALDDVMSELQSKKALNKREQSFMQVVNPTGGGDEDKPLHEKMGNRIASRILRHILLNNSTISSDPLKQLFYLLVQQITVEILRTDEDDVGLFASLHKIIAGSIDADRLDYVVRDLQNSGFTQGRLDFDRLISGFRLLHIETEGFCFCPSIRALSTIEDFFHLRWFLYRFVIFHHRIVKTDYLLGNAIASLAKAYLGIEDADSQSSGTNVPYDISGLWRAIADAWLTRTYFDMLVQWDDAWLQTVLRREYYKGVENPIVRDQLEELISNRKKYESLIKRMDDFLEIDQSILQNLKLNTHLINQLEKEDTEQKDQILNQVKRLVEFILSFQKGEYERTTESYSTRHGFFVFQLRMILQVVSKAGIVLNAKDTFGISMRNSKDILEPLITEYVCEVVKRQHHKDCIVVFKNLKTGLDNEPFIYCEGDRIVNLGDVSTIKSDLDNNRKVFPVFFIYASPPNSTINKRDLRVQIGICLGDKLSILFNELINKILAVRKEAEERRSLA